MPDGTRIFVVEFDGADVLPKCLDSLVRTVPDGIPITIIDNASPSDTPRLIPDQYKNRYEIVRLDKNEGYAGAIARAWEIGSEEFLIIANNDLEFTPGWFEALLETTHRTEAHAVSAVIEHENESDLHKSTNASLNPLLYLIHGVFTDRTKAVYPSGACFILRRDGSVPCPIVDRDYFLYYEDVYIGFLLRSLGKKIVQCPESIVKHIGSHTVKRSNPNRIAFIQERNRLLTMCLFYDWSTFLLLSPWFFLDAIIKPITCLMRKKPFWATAMAHFWIPFHWLYVLKKYIALRKFPDFKASRIYPYFTSKILPDNAPASSFFNRIARWWFRLIGIPVDREAEG